MSDDTEIKREPVVVWKYIHPEAFLAGVPARDLTDQDLEVMDSEQIAAVQKSGLYEEVKPQKAAGK